ncbi:hypothetical protein Tco_0471802 [Tanacetum coccineum]
MVAYLTTFALGYKPMGYSVLLPILVSGLDTNSPDELLEDSTQLMTWLAAAIDVISATNILEFTNEDIQQEWNCHLCRVIRVYDEDVIR